MGAGTNETVILRGAILQAICEDNKNASQPPRLRATRATPAPPIVRRVHGQGRRTIIVLAGALLAIGLSSTPVSMQPPPSATMLAPEVAATGAEAGPARGRDEAAPIEKPAFAAVSAAARSGSSAPPPWPSSARADSELPSWPEANNFSLANYNLLTAADAPPITALFGLGVRAIVIDAGHGGDQLGAVGAGGLREKDVTLDVANRLKARLERNGGYQVVMTRSGDETVSLARRAELANAAGADLFISIHVNSLPNGPFNIIETFYFGPPQDAATLKLAVAENQESEWPIGAFKTVIEKIGDTLKRQESLALARNIQASLYDNVKRHDADVIDKGVKVAPFAVLLGVDAPSVLAEISCITDPREEAKLRTPEYREQVASFLEDGIVNYLAQRRLRTGGAARYDPKNSNEAEISDRKSDG